MSAFMFKYRPAGSNTWTVPGARKPYKTADSVRKAADKWAADMASEGCPVVTECFALVSDDRGGMVEGDTI